MAPPSIYNTPPASDVKLSSPRSRGISYPVARFRHTIAKSRNHLLRIHTVRQRQSSITTSVPETGYGDFAIRMLFAHGSEEPCDKQKTTQATSPPSLATNGPTKLVWPDLPPCKPLGVGKRQEGVQRRPQSTALWPWPPLAAAVRFDSLRVWRNFSRGSLLKSPFESTRLGWISGISNAINHRPGQLGQRTESRTPKQASGRKRRPMILPG